MSNFKKFSAYADVPCTWVSEVIPDDDKVKCLKAENAKLRELASKAISLASEHCESYYGEYCHDGSCDWDNIVIEQEGKPTRFTCEIGVLFDDARKLGVDVSE